MKAAKKDAFEWTKLQYNTTQGRSEVSIELSQILVWFKNEYQMSMKKKSIDRGRGLISFSFSRGILPQFLMRNQSVACFLSISIPA